jgi:hypothetical protein
MDRYASFEVGFLLQRLEQSGVLVILASNLNETSTRPLPANSTTSSTSSAREVGTRTNMAAPLPRGLLASDIDLAKANRRE